MAEALIHAYLIDSAGAAKKLDWQGVRAWSPDQGLLWVHLQIDEPETRQWLERDSGIPAHVVPTMLAIETRPRASAVGDNLLILLRGVNLNPGAEPEDMVSIRLWVEANRIVSTRRRGLQSVMDTVASLQGRPVSGPGDLLLRLADRLTERINDVINEREEHMDDLEDSLLEEPSQVMRSNLAELRRDAISLRRYLAPQREAMARLLAEVLPWFTDMDRSRAREIHDRLMRLVEDLDSVRERSSVLHEELVSRLSDQLNQRMYILSIVAVIFLPLGFLTGLLGINVGGIPGANSPYGFWTFTALLAGVLGFQIWFFVRNKWFRQ